MFTVCVIEKTLYTATQIETQGERLTHGGIASRFR